MVFHFIKTAYGGTSNSSKVVLIIFEYMSSNLFSLLAFRSLDIILNSYKLSSCSEIMELFVSFLRHSVNTLPLLGNLATRSSLMLTK